MSKFKPDPAVMADLLRAAEWIDDGGEYCCHAICQKNALSCFVDLFKPQTEEESKTRCVYAWMSIKGTEEAQHNTPETQLRRVMALLLTREIYRCGDHVEAN